MALLALLWETWPKGRAYAPVRNRDLVARKSTQPKETDMYGFCDEIASIDEPPTDGLDERDEREGDDGTNIVHP